MKYHELPTWLVDGTQPKPVKATEHFVGDHDVYVIETRHWSDGWVARVVSFYMTPDPSGRTATTVWADSLTEGWAPGGHQWGSSKSMWGMVF